MQNLNQSGGFNQPPFLCLKVKHLPQVYKILNQIEGQALTDISPDCYEEILNFLESVGVESSVFGSITQFFEFIKPLYTSEVLPDLQTDISNKRLVNLRKQLELETDKDKRIELKQTISLAKQKAKHSDLIQQQQDAYTRLYGAEYAQVMLWILNSGIPLKTALEMDFKQFVDEFNLKTLKQNIEYSHHLESQSKQAQQEAINKAKGNF